MIRPLYHDAMRHKGGAALCLDCRRDRARAARVVPVALKECVEQAIRYWHGAYGPDPIPGRDDDFKAGWHSRDQCIRELQQALSDHALGVESGGGNRAHEDRCPLCIQCGSYGTVGTDDLASIAHKPDCRVNGLLRLRGLTEADPDVADTAWAIIDHHRQHRTAG